MFSDDDNYYYGEYPRKKNTMATAAMTLGFLSLVTCSVFYLAVPCAAMAILCAILSRTGKRMTGRGRTGLICGILGMVCSVGVTAYSVYYVWNSPQLRFSVQQYMEFYREQLGLSQQELPFPWESGAEEEPGTSNDTGDSDSKEKDDPENGDSPYYDRGQDSLEDLFDYFYGTPSQQPEPSRDISGGEFI